MSTFACGAVNCVSRTIQKDPDIVVVPIEEADACHHDYYEDTNAECHETALIFGGSA